MDLHDISMPLQVIGTNSGVWLSGQTERIFCKAMIYIMYLQAVRQEGAQLT